MEMKTDSQKNNFHLLPLFWFNTKKFGFYQKLFTTTLDFAEINLWSQVYSPFLKLKVCPFQFFSVRFRVAFSVPGCVMTVHFQHVTADIQQVAAFELATMVLVAVCGSSSLHHSEFINVFCERLLGLFVNFASIVVIVVIVEIA